MQGFVDKYVYFFPFHAEIQDGHQKWQENDFWEKSLVDSVDTLRIKNFIKITLSRTVIEINVFFPFTQKFKMATKNGGKTIFEKLPVHSGDTLWVKNFVEIALSLTVSQINAFLPFTQKFKMPKMAGKQFWEKSPVDFAVTL